MYEAIKFFGLEESAFVANRLSGLRPFVDHIRLRNTRQLSESRVCAVSVLSLSLSLSESSLRKTRRRK